MKIDCVGDLHGFFPQLKGGDLLLIVGDLTARDEKEEYTQFCEWLDAQPYYKKIVIAGNHDANIDFDAIESMRNCYYLEDSGAHYEGMRIWGSPWTLKFYGMNPKCMAYSLDTEEELNEKWNLIPNGIDILVTHSPCYGILDKVNMKQRHVGSSSLYNHVLGRIHPKLHVCGHIHDAYGTVEMNATKYVNCSYVNEYYDPVNDPIRVILRETQKDSQSADQVQSV